MTASAFNADLGAPALAVGIVVSIAISFQDHGMPKKILKDVSWSVIPLVAGLFVIVEGMTNAGAQRFAVNALEQMRFWKPLASGMSAAFGVALISNIMNNLPSGLIAGAAVHAASITGALRDTVLIGVDLGPNLSVSGLARYHLVADCHPARGTRGRLLALSEMGSAGDDAGAGVYGAGVAGQLRVVDEPGRPQKTMVCPTM